MKIMGIRALFIAGPPKCHGVTFAVFPLYHFISNLNEYFCIFIMYYIVIPTIR